MRELHGVDRLLVAVQELSLARTLERVADVVRHAARDLAEADGASFILRDDGQCFYLEEDAIEPLWRGMRFPLENCVSGWAMLHREPVVIPDIYADDRVPHEAYRPTFVTSMAMVPIRQLDPIGAIGNYWAEPHTATETEVHLLQALANAASTALENIALQGELDCATRRATTDELTGLLSRRGFQLTAEATLEAARESGVNALVAYIDVDGLKTANDTHGHTAGDRLIQAAAGALAAVVREKDLVARMGGDEFCVLATDVPLAGEVLERRLQGELAAREVDASIGFVEVGPESHLSLLQLIDLADARMYADKQDRRTGRQAVLTS